jgi:AAA domain
MPSMDEHPSSELVKMLVFGISGSGKTGLIGKLAEAGYRIFAADFDDGMDILKDPVVMRPDVRKNVYFKTLKDNALAIGSKLLPQATAWTEFVSLLSDWKEGPTSLGNFRSWGPKDVLWIDSCTFMSDAAMNRALQVGGRLGQRPQIQDYGAAMDDIASVFELLYSPHCKCNVVVTSHLQFAADENFGGARKAMVSVLGNKLAPKIPRYFNNMVLLKKSVVGGKVVRKLFTQGDATVDLKTSKPSVVPPEMEPDLAKLFSLLTGP